MPNQDLSSLHVKLDVQMQMLFKLDQNEQKLIQLGSLQLEILRKIAEAIDNLTAWLQQEPSTAIPDLLADIVAKLNLAHEKLDWLMLNPQYQRPGPNTTQHRTPV